MDDKLCSFSGLHALIEAASSQNGELLKKSHDTMILGLFDNEEIGSTLPYGAKSNLLESVCARVVECLAYHWEEKDVRAARGIYPPPPDAGGKGKLPIQVRSLHLPLSTIY
jgi:aspartyl aminopeptidase